MAYNEIIEIEPGEYIEIDIICEGVSVNYIFDEAAAAFLEAGEFMRDNKKSLHHTSKFEIHLMLDGR